MTRKATRYTPRHDRMSRRRRPFSSERCIYCSSTEPRRCREHVIPQALGTFSQNWTLTCVCKTCNQTFGRELETLLGRDSSEAFLRFEHGVATRDTASKLLNRRVTTRIAAPHTFGGVRLRLRAADDGKKLEPDLIPQIGMRRPGGAWEYFAEQDLTLDLLRRFEGDAEMQLLGLPTESFRLLAKLVSLGARFEGTGHASRVTIADTGPLSIEQEVAFDLPLRRAGAKIAFNYAAKVLGADVVRGEAFDQIREFVRRGMEPRPLVIAGQFSSLINEATPLRGHVVTIEWMPSRQELVAIVSLFNWISYGVTLGEGDGTRWAAIAHRHFFDLESREVRAFVVDAVGNATAIAEDKVRP